MTLVTVKQARIEIPFERLEPHRLHQIFKKALVTEFRLWFVEPRPYFSLESLWSGYREALEAQMAAERQIGDALIDLPPENVLPPAFQGLLVPPKRSGMHA